MIDISIQRRPCARACAPTLVMLHGWGYSKTAWPESWLLALSTHFDLWLVDLPGHGDDTCELTRDPELAELDAWLQRLGNCLPAQYSLLGWSLGGQVAMRLAQQQANRVTGLVALASNLSFVQRDDWPHAMNPEVLHKFQAAFAVSPSKTLQRFCGLQAQGSDELMPMTKLLSKQVQCRDSLAMGLEWLAQLDLRCAWQTMPAASVLLLASNDALIPAQLADSIQTLSSNGQRVEVVAGSHALAWQYAQSENDTLLPQVMAVLESAHV